MLIKICGITDADDVRMCLSMGVDLLGFNIYPGSSRYVDYNRLEGLLDMAPSEKTVIVGVDTPADQLEWILALHRPGYVQMHGRETMRDTGKIKERFPDVKIIKKVVPAQREEFVRWLDYADLLICDSDTDKHGGSGKKFDWELFENIDSAVKNRILAAGGITPDNISELLGYGILGVDIASGVEKSPGRKDSDKLRKLLDRMGRNG